MFGRPPKLPPQQVKQAQRLHADGVGLRIGARSGVSHTIAATLRRADTTTITKATTTSTGGRRG